MTMPPPVPVLRILSTPPTPPSTAPAPGPDPHRGHAGATYPGGISVCLDCERAERCVCGGWIVDDLEPLDGGFAAIRRHQREAQHVAYHDARHEPGCPFCRLGAAGGEDREA